MKSLRTAICLVASAALIPVARAQSPWLHVYGSFDSESLGQNGRTAIAGDLDGDGMAEVLVGVRASGSARVLIIRGRDGTVLETLTAGPNHRSGFGTCVADAGDVDRDGVSDLLIGQPTVPSEGSVFVYSGRTRKLLYYLIGDKVGEQFGLTVAGAGDVDLDGHADLLIGAPLATRTLASAGVVYVYSGGKQTVIRTLEGATAYGNLGWALAQAGDVDGDGYPDQIVGAPGSGSQLARAIVYSGKDGSILYQWSDALGGKLGERVALAGDVDRDGRPDFAVGAPWANLEQRGSVTLFSGRDGSVLRVLAGDSRGLWLGSSVAAAGDIDADGYADVLTGGPGTGTGSTTFGLARVYSGKNGSILFETRGVLDMKYEGAGVGSGADVDGDGKMDFWIGTPGWGGRLQDYGIVRVYSSRALALTTDRNTLSVADGGKQVWQLDLRGKLGNQLYLVLGSVSGTTPGLSLGALTLPLNPDAWFWFTATAASNPPLVGSIGFLSTQGRAEAGFSLPRQSDTGLVGLRFHHAFVVFGLRLDSFDFASNAVPLTLVN